MVTSVGVQGEFRIAFGREADSQDPGGGIIYHITSPHPLATAIPFRTVNDGPPFLPNVSCP